MDERLFRDGATALERRVRTSVLPIPAGQPLTGGRCPTSSLPHTTVKPVQPELGRASETVEIARIASVSEACCMLVLLTHSLESPKSPVTLHSAECAAAVAIDELPIGVNCKTGESTSSTYISLRTPRLSAVAKTLH